jgi:hypothetical protein
MDMNTESLTLGQRRRPLTPAELVGIGMSVGLARNQRAWEFQQERDRLGASASFPPVPSINPMEIHPAAGRCSRCRAVHRKKAKFCPRCGEPAFCEAVSQTTPLPRRSSLRWPVGLLLTVCPFLISLAVGVRLFDGTAPTRSAVAPIDGSYRGDVFDEFEAEQRAAQTAPMRDQPSGPMVEPTGPTAVTQSAPAVAENGSFYGEISQRTELPRNTYVQGYYRNNGTYVRSYYRSR